MRYGSASVKNCSTHGINEQPAGSERATDINVHPGALLPQVWSSFANYKPEEQQQQQQQQTHAKEEMGTEAEIEEERERGVPLKRVQEGEEVREEKREYN